MTRDELEAELEREHPAAFVWALRCCKGHREEAEDALHAAYERILDGSVRCDGRSRFRTWLFGVVRITALEQQRRGWLRLVRLQRWFDRSSADPVPAAEQDALLEAAELAERLGRAVDRLSKRQREVLHLVFYQELSVQEAAAVLGIPVGTCRTHYERGKARLRRLLTGDPR